MRPELVKHDPVAHDVDEEGPPARELEIDVAKAVDDQPDRRREPLGDAIFAQENILGLVPVIDRIGEPLVVDDDEDVVIRIIAALGIGDPVAAR